MSKYTKYTELDCRY